MLCVKSAQLLLVWLYSSRTEPTLFIVSSRSNAARIVGPAAPNAPETVGRNAGLIHPTDVGE
jgi:hypothetical protein